MIEYFIFELGCSNSEKKTLKWEENSREIPDVSDEYVKLVTFPY